LKPLLIILKTLLIGCLWSIIFLDGLRVVMLINWHFDIFLKGHWSLLSQKWNSGASMSRSEILFFLIIVTSIPLWLSGWIGLCLIKWEHYLKKVIFSPLYLIKKLTLKTKPPVVVKKKSISEETKVIKKAPVIKKVAVKRPPLPSATLMQSNINTQRSAASAYPTASKKNPEITTNHALFNFDEDDFDLDFDFDKPSKNINSPENIPSALKVDDEPQEYKQEEERKEIKPHQDKKNNREQPKQKAGRQEQAQKESHTPVLDELKQKGYDIITSAIIKGTNIDYIAVSKNEILLCLVDKEIGDWLADEERFNDEEPLWFSESSHRISPVRKIDVAREILKNKLATTDMNFNITSYVIIQAGHIINAEDMFEIWDGMNINVTRINRGTPKEIRYFPKVLDVCEEKTNKETIEKLKKLVRSLA